MSNEIKKKQFATSTMATGSKLGEEAKERWGLPDEAADDDTVALASVVDVPKND